MRRERLYYVYILASERTGTLYIGMTNDLGRRVYEHREGLVDGFTKRYRVKSLVYFETYPPPRTQFIAKSVLKKYPRLWKLNLIFEHNPDWRDLAETLNA